VGKVNTSNMTERWVTDQKPNSRNWFYDRDQCVPDWITP